MEAPCKLIAPIPLKKGSPGRCSNHVKMEVFPDISDLYQTPHQVYDSEGQKTVFWCSVVYSPSPLHQASIHTCRKDTVLLPGSLRSSQGDGFLHPQGEKTAYFQTDFFIKRFYKMLML